MYGGQLAEKASAATIIHSPRHPYTKLLISSLPEIGVRYDETKLAGIPGTPPALLHPPEGCRFRERCPLATAACKRRPPFREIAPDHQVACWRAAA
jgi:peptide/nickel transport system ATP-binding protein